jgi:acyl carrier protein
MSSEAERVQLTEDERLRLRRALAEAELLRGEDAWDSLDLVSALTVAEYELGISLDETLLSPGELLDLAGLEAAIEACGVRQPGGARLRLDVRSPDDQRPGQGSRQRLRARRQLEYRLALAAAPGVRSAVSRGPQFSLLTCASDPAHLPLQATFSAAAGWTQKAPGQAWMLPLSGPAAPGLPREAGQLIEDVQQHVQALVIQRGGALWAPVSPLIAMETLAHLGYSTAHPEQIVQLTPQLALLPAGCLNVYPLLATTGSLVLGTFLATVFRREPRYDPRTGRLPAFTCREMLWCARRAWEEDFTGEIEDSLAQLAATLAIQGAWVTAHDPFFLAESAGGCKREFRARTPAGEIALASINRHGEHFIARGYGRAGLVTGCAGLGLERWALAAGYQ